MMQPRPLSPRKTVQLLVILTILAWATQTLVSQWGYGQTTRPAPAAAAAPAASGALELRCETIVDGNDITLKQLCKWDEQSDISGFAELVVAQLTEDKPVQQIGVEAVRAALVEAGADVEMIDFAGASTCAVRRADVDDEAFARLLTGQGEIEQVEVAEVAMPQAPVETAAATKPAYYKKLVLARSLSSGQKVMTDDVAIQLLIEKGDATEPEVSPDAVIGQVLVKDMKRGDAITASDVRPEPVVLKDQFITISIPHQGRMIETVARAMEAGIAGQTIKAKNEATDEIYQVIVTAPAAGEIDANAPKALIDIASTND